MYKVEKDLGCVCLMDPEDLPPAAAKPTLRRRQPNGRKMGNGAGEGRLQQCPVCSAHHQLPPQLAMASSEQQLNALGQPCSSLCPASLRLPSSRLAELTGITSERRRLKQKMRESFSLLNPPVVLLCSGKNKRLKGN